MSVVFDTSGERLLRTTDLPNCNAAYTVTAWIRLASVASNARLLQFGTDSNATSDIFSFTSVPNWRVTVNNSGAIDFGTPVVDTWYFYAMRRNSATSIIGAVNAAYSAANTTDVSARTAAVQITIGSSGAQTQSFEIAHAKLWTAALSDAEIAIEALTVAPTRTADLYGWWPLSVHTDVNDYSGNARHWTTAGTLSTGTDPGIPMTIGGGTLTPTVWTNKWALEVLTI